MSTNPENGGRADDRIVTLVSRWLARHLDDAQLRTGIQEIGSGELAPDQAEAVQELLDELDRSRSGARGEAERVARETLEAIALGG